MQVNAQEERAAWHVVQTKPRQEFRALQHLQNQSYVCFLPAARTRKVVRGRFVHTTEPLFSRYLFIRINPAACRMTSLSSTRGVAKLVSFGGRFATVSDDVVEALQLMLRPALAPFAPGNHVVVRHGPLAGLEGIYQIPNGDERAIILIEFLSRPQNVSIKLAHLQKAD
jgi:transcriptional antiterminator RfaH